MITSRPLRLLAAPALATALVVAACGADDATAGSDDNTEAAEETTTSVTADSPETTESANAADDGAETTQSDDGDDGDDGDDAASGDELSIRAEVAQNARWGDNVTITIDGSNLVFESDGLPSHDILDQYLGDGRDGKFLAGGAESYDARFEIPLVPTLAAAPAETPGGAIGVAISGAVFFDPFEGDGSGTVANDDNATIDGVPFIDACGGHPLPNGLSYHYHGIPFCITDAVDTPGEHSVLIGYLFDGHAIYGPQDVGGEEPTDLDECMGHVGPTPEFDEDTYHYHVSSSANYISECLVGEATFGRSR